MKPEQDSVRPYLEMRDIVVAFGGVRILEEAHLSIRRGEIHALLGENGAGKSSMIKVLCGLYKREAGDIFFEGRKIQIKNPETAHSHGIAMIHQELPFAGHLTVAENLFLGREYVRGWYRKLDDDRMNREAEQVLRPFDADIDPRSAIGRLNVARQQIVAIAKALATGAQVIALDEATSAISEREIERLFQIIGRLREKGRTFIMVTHKLDEVFAVADRATVMRDGCTVYTAQVHKSGREELVSAMVGRSVDQLFPAHRRDPTDVILKANRIGNGIIRNVSLELRRGEVLGVAGLMGAGRTELFDALFGVRPITSGGLVMNDQMIEIRSPRDAIAHKMAYITEDRKGNGLALLLGVRDNIVLASLNDHTRWSVVNDRSVDNVLDKYIEILKIRAKTMNRVGVLSGGNQQKVVIAKWLATGADIFLLDEPTRGIDVQTKHEIYELINKLTGRGKAVILVTSELPELLAMSDRIIVMSQRTTVKEFTRQEASPEAIVKYAASKIRT